MIFYPYFENYMPVEKPPTLYALINSRVNYTRPADDQIKIEQLPSYGRDVIFNFDYTLSSAITKEDFEEDIITHFFERRIGFDTVLSFRMHFKNKLREILPVINPMFDALNELNIADSEVVTRERTESGSRETERDTTSSGTNSGTDNLTGSTSGTDNLTGSTSGTESIDKTSSESETVGKETSGTETIDNTTSGTASNSTTGTSGNTSVNKYSDTPQSQLSLVDNDSYLTDYRTITDSGNTSETSSGTTSGTESSEKESSGTEDITRTTSGSESVESESSGSETSSRTTSGTETSSRTTSGTESSTGSMTGSDTDSREEREVITRDKVLENFVIWNENKINIMNFVYDSLEELFYQLA